MTLNDIGTRLAIAFNQFQAGSDSSSLRENFPGWGLVNGPPPTTPYNNTPNNQRLQQEIANTPDQSRQRALTMDRTPALNQYQKALTLKDLKTLQYFSTLFPDDPRFHLHEKQF